MSKEIDRSEVIGTQALDVRLADGGQRLFRVEIGEKPGTLSFALFDPERDGRMRMCGLYSLEQMAGLADAISRMVAIVGADTMVAFSGGVS